MSWTIGPVPLLLGLAGGYQLMRLMIAEKKPRKKARASNEEWIAVVGTAPLLAALLLYPLGGVEHARLGGMSWVQCFSIVVPAYVVFAVSLEWLLVQRGNTPPVWTGVGLTSRSRSRVSNVTIGLCLSIFLPSLTFGLANLVSFSSSTFPSRTVWSRSAELLLGDRSTNFAITYSVGFSVGMIVLIGIYTLAHEFVRWREQAGDDAGQR